MFKASSRVFNLNDGLEITRFCTDVLTVIFLLFNRDGNPVIDNVLPEKLSRDILLGRLSTLKILILSIAISDVVTLSPLLMYYLLNL